MANVEKALYCKISSHELSKITMFLKNLFLIFINRTLDLGCIRVCILLAFNSDLLYFSLSPGSYIELRNSKKCLNCLCLNVLLRETF